MDKNYGTYRIGEKKKKEYLKRSHKKVSNLYEKVKEYVLYLRDLDDNAFQKETGRYSKSITKEGLANTFKVKPHEIEQCFKKLNLEGILSHPHRNHAHDTNRNPMFPGSESGWAADIYYFKGTLDRWFRAIESKNKDKIKEMIQNGIDINVRDNWKSALAVAIDTRDISFIRFLLEEGANPVHNNDLYHLAYALNEKNTEILSLILDYTTDPFIEDIDGENVFFQSCKKYPDFVPMLIERGFKMNSKNKLGQTPLMVAIENKQTKVVEFLFEKGASIKEKDAKKKTVFMYALENGEKEVLKLFIPIRDSLTKDEKKLFKKVRMRLIF